MNSEVFPDPVWKGAKATPVSLALLLLPIPFSRTHRSLDEVDLPLLELEIVEVKLEIPDGVVSSGRVLEPSEGRVLEPDEIRVLGGRFDGSGDVSVDELGLLEELVETAKGDEGLDVLRDLEDGAEGLGEDGEDRDGGEDLGGSLESKGERAERGVGSVRAGFVVRDGRETTNEVSLLDDGEAGEGDDHDEEGKRVCHGGRQREEVSSLRLFASTAAPAGFDDYSQFATLMPSDKSFLFLLSLSSFARSS